MQSLISLLSGSLFWFWPQLIKCMAPTGHFVKQDFTDVVQTSEGFHCLHWMDFTPNEVFYTIFQNKYYRKLSNLSGFPCLIQFFLFILLMRFSLGHYAYFYLNHKKRLWYTTQPEEKMGIVCLINIPQKLIQLASIIHL